MLTIPLLISLVVSIGRLAEPANLLTEAFSFSKDVPVLRARLDALLLLFLWTYIAARASYHHRRQTIIEDELMSVHSCAIVWQAVVIAHYRALKATADNQYRHYTEVLAKEAAEIAARPFHIHEWIAPRPTSS